jgi:hypothetical protein
MQPDALADLFGASHQSRRLIFARTAAAGRSSPESGPDRNLPSTESSGYGDALPSCVALTCSPTSSWRHSASISWDSHDLLLPVAQNHHFGIFMIALQGTTFYWRVALSNAKGHRKF